MKLLIVVIGFALAGLAIAKAPTGMSCQGEGNDQKCQLKKGKQAPKGWTCSPEPLLDLFGTAPRPYCVKSLPKELEVNSAGKVLLKFGQLQAPEGWECAFKLLEGGNICMKAEVEEEEEDDSAESKKESKEESKKEDDDSAESKKESKKEKESSEEEVPAAYFQSSEEFY